MPIYRFHVCDGAGFREDPEGMELPDRDAARQEALRRARSLMVEELMEARLNLASFVEVEDAQRELLFTVTFDDAVRIADPRPGTAEIPPPRRT